MEMQSPSITFKYGDAEVECRLTEIDPDNIFLALGFCEEPRIYPRGSMIFDTANADVDVVKICGVEIRSDEELVRAIVYYVRLEEPYDLRELLESISEMRRDYVSVVVDGNEFSSNNLYEQGIHNKLLLFSDREMRDRLSSITIKGDNSSLRFRSPSLLSDYYLRGPYVSKALVKQVIMEQSVIKIANPGGKYMFEFGRPCTLLKFLRLFIVAFNRHMELPVSRNKSARK